MSYKAFFSFASGINKTIIVPTGTIEKIREHISDIEVTLNISREKYLDNPVYWKHIDYSSVDDKTLCESAQEHNSTVITFYENLRKWAEESIISGEDLTNEIFQELLVGLQLITVPPNRWTGEYYTAKMETLYEVMRGREYEGISFGAKKLTEKQAAQVILLFSEFLDTHDRRLDVPKGQDYLASSYDGGYEWCEICGAVTLDYISDRCKRKSKCPLRIEEED